MTHVTCRLTAKNREQLRNPTLGNRVWATFTFYRPNGLNTHLSDTDVDYTWFGIGSSIPFVAVHWPIGHYVAHMPLL